MGQGALVVWPMTNSCLALIEGPMEVRRPVDRMRAHDSGAGKNVTERCLECKRAPPLTSAAPVSLLPVAVRLGTILGPLSEAPMVPAGAYCIVEAAISGAGRATSGCSDGPWSWSGGGPAQREEFPSGERIPRCAAGARRCQQVCQHSRAPAGRWNP
jgi:hypothetical protein